MATKARKVKIPKDAARFLPPLILFLATVATRLIPFNVTLVGWDEWILTGISVRLARFYMPTHEWYDILVPTGYSYPPFFFWLNGGLIAILGTAPLVCRMVTIASEAACIVTICVLGQHLAGRFAAWAAGLLAFATLYLSFHETVTMDFLLSFWILLSLLFLLRCVRDAKAGDLVWAVFFSSVAVFTKYHGVVYHAILCALIVLLPATRRMLRGRTLFGCVVVALALPCALLALEGLTWHFYGYNKTHIAEVIRVMGWTSYVQDPSTGRIVEATWGYYFRYLWHMLGPVVCVLGAVSMGYALAARRLDLAVIAIVVGLWFLWASTASLKNARYILPGVIMIYPLAGAMLHRIAQQGRYGKGAAIAVLALAGCVGLWDTRARVGAYLREAAMQQTVYDYVRDRIPTDAVIFAESAPFQWGMSLRSGAVRPMRNPENPSAFDDAQYAIMHEWGHQLIEGGAIPSAKGYLERRDAAVNDWDKVLDLGAGRERIVVLRKR